MEIEYPDRDAALAAHAEAMEIRFERARDALLKDDQLESALARPRNAAPDRAGGVQWSTWYNRVDRVAELPGP